MDIDFRIYFGESIISGNDEDYYARSNNPRLLEFEKNNKLMIVFVCDVFLDDPKVMYSKLFVLQK